MTLLEFASETGPLEIGEIVLLSLSAVVFFMIAMRGRMGGAPVYALLALVFAVAAVREFDTDAIDPLSLYLTGHAVRWHMALLMLIPVLGILYRDRALPLKIHVQKTWRLGMFLFGAALLVGLAGLVERKTKNLADGHWIADYAIFAEEALELAAYGMALILALRIWRTLAADRAVNPDGRAVHLAP